MPRPKGSKNKKKDGEEKEISTLPGGAVDKVVPMLDAGSSIDEIEADLKIPREAIAEIKSDWLNDKRKKYHERKEAYLKSNHVAFKSAKEKSKGDK